MSIFTDLSMQKIIIGSRVRQYNLYFIKVDGLIIMHTNSSEYTENYTSLKARISTGKLQK